jgi:hypothetical protein
MSTNLPPTGPPSGPPTGPPPSGPPPAGPPASSAEVLEQGGGGPMPPAPPTGSSDGGRRKALIIGGVIGVLALGGAAFAGYTWLTATGPQPAEALPADTLGYVSIDLDPSGSQKIAFYNMAKKFPAAKEWLDDEGIGSGDDIRKFVFDKIQEEEGACQSLDFEDDIKPWLGDRFAVAAIDRGKDETPAPVGVVQVKDADDAQDRAEKVIEECGGNPDDGGLAMSGDWLIIAETDDIAEQVADDAGEASLADDEEFGKWTEAAGDPGILTAYASADAGKVLAEEFGGLGGMLLPGGGMSECSAELPGFEEDGEPLPGDDFMDGCLDGLEEESPGSDVEDMFEEFGGMAMTVRFDDGSLEVEVASNTEGIGLNALTSSDNASDVIATLPEGTAAALGVGFEPGWFDEVLDYLEKTSGGELDVDEFLAQAAEELDLSLPEDAETLFGESTAIAVGSDFDPEVMFGSMSGLSELPLGAKIKGDTDAIEEVLDKIKATAPTPEDAEILSTDKNDDYIVIGPSDAYLSELLEDGELGDTDIYQDVIREDDASSIFFVNFNAGDDWLLKLVDGDDEAKENLEPLGGLGLTGWQDDGVGHAVFRLTTD